VDGDGVNKLIHINLGEDAHLKVKNMRRSCWRQYMLILLEHEMLTKAFRIKLGVGAWVIHRKNTFKGLKRVQEGTQPFCVKFMFFSENATAGSQC
jgi:hypothetical protein